MTPTELETLLIGKTIKHVRWHSYIVWPMCVDEIEFTDGTIVEVAGNADEGRFDSVVLPNGDRHNVDDDDS